MRVCSIDYMAAAQQRWGELHIVYPARSIWNEHPYYILDVPWSDVDHREAARTFLKFLMSEPIQRSALDHGFRPGDPSIPVRFPESLLVKKRKIGADDRSPDHVLLAQGRGVEEPPRLVPPDRALTT